MKTEYKDLICKTAKAACLTCVAAGAVALVASGTALKLVAEGAKGLKELFCKDEAKAPADAAAPVEAEAVEVQDAAPEQPAAPAAEAPAAPVAETPEGAAF